MNFIIDKMIEEVCEYRENLLEKVLNEELKNGDYRYVTFIERHSTYDTINKKVNYDIIIFKHNTLSELNLYELKPTQLYVYDLTNEKLLNLLGNKK